MSKACYIKKIKKIPGQKGEQRYYEDKIHDDA